MIKQIYKISEVCFIKLNHKYILMIKTLKKRLEKLKLKYKIF